MECRNITKSLKINPKKKIGNVVIVVEGADYEFELLKQIFRNVLKYNYCEKRRTKSKVDEFTIKDDKFSKVYVINAKNSNISTLKEDDDYINNIYKLLYEEYGLDTANMRVYFLWDRDSESNAAGTVKKLLNDLYSSLDNKFNMNGLLLLSYSSIEAYTISNFEIERKNVKDKSLKDYVKSKKYYSKNINKNTLLNAAYTMHKSLESLGINRYDPDNMQETSVKIFENEEKYYQENDVYRLLSLLSIMFIDLGIIYKSQWEITDF